LDNLEYSREQWRIQGGGGAGGREAAPQAGLTLKKKKSRRFKNLGKIKNWIFLGHFFKILIKFTK